MRTATVTFYRYNCTSRRNAICCRKTVSCWDAVCHENAFRRKNTACCTSFAVFKDPSNYCATIEYWHASCCSDFIFSPLQVCAFSETYASNRLTLAVAATVTVTGPQSVVSLNSTRLLKTLRLAEFANAELYLFYILPPFRIATFSAVESSIVSSYVNVSELQGTMQLVYPIPIMRNFKFASQLSSYCAFTGKYA